ncbi:dihydropteroate synthase [Rhodocytophaga rosea]|nr:dihydropteroate synthase [Rhodocytophaga rosea]
MPQLDSLFETRKTLLLKGKIQDLSVPAVMGIINVTPDSFYAGSRQQQLQDIVQLARKMTEQGATFIDIGGSSTRPGAADISEEEELKRVIPAIDAILKELPEANISIDTYRARVARIAVETGACVVNDISGGELDKQMFETVSQLQVPYILMHMRGTPQSMASLHTYENIIGEMMQYFQQKVYLLRQLELKDIILDIGFGFAKNIEQNYYLLRYLDKFRIFGLPLLAGLSRKSLIYKKLNIPVEEALNGTTVLNTLALTKGVSLLRVHDVKESVETVKLFTLYSRE